MSEKCEKILIKIDTLLAFYGITSAEDNPELTEGKSRTMIDKKLATAEQRQLAEVHCFLIIHFRTLQFGYVR